VWGRARDGNGPAIVLCAHLDTVFAGDVSHRTHVDGDRLRGPGVGDDSVALAAVSAVANLLGATGAPVWLLATVGEEGLGDLMGVRGALAGPPAPLDALIAVEGNYFGRVSRVGVGSLRWRVTVRGPGGHAWEASSVPSAVHAMASMITDLALMQVDGAATAINAGRAGGGEAINARARSAWFDLDLRADDAHALDLLEGGARAAIGAHAVNGIEADLEELGRRPAGSLDAAHPLVVAAAGALERAGVSPRFVATSTDANAAHAVSLPAIAVGITTGSGEHTPQEWIDIPPIANGVAVLAATVTAYGERMRGEESR
jgi:acetylornithine deacetylase/succinyl-diaminopimelate desuccinylase-like protein